MTTARTDPELGLVFPIVVTFGDQPPHEIGVIKAGIAPEQVIAELAGALRDCANIIEVGADEAVRLGRARLADLQRLAGGGAVAVDYADGCGPGCACGTVGDTVQRLGRTYHQALGERVLHDGPLGTCAVCAPIAAYDAGVLTRLAGEVTGHAIAAAREPLTTAEALALAAGERDPGQLRGHCAHDEPLSRPCRMCDRQ